MIPALEALSLNLFIVREVPTTFFELQGISGMMANLPVNLSQGFPGGSVVKNLPASLGDRFNSWIGKIPWRRKWQPTPVFLPGEFHGQRSLAGYSPWGLESDTTDSD